MPSSYSTDLKLELMVTGEKAGLWGDITNTNLNIVSQAIAGREAVSVASTDAVTLTFTDGALSNGKNAVIDITGTPSADCNVSIPDGIEKIYIVKNSTGGTSTLTIKTATGTGVTFGDNEKTTKIVYSDGTNIVDTGLTDLASDYSPQLSATLDTNGNDIIVDDGGAIEDDSNNPYVKFAKTASAVNEVSITNQATGSGPDIAATGTDTNVDLNLTPKGIGRVTLGAAKIEQTAEKATVSATAATGTINYDVITQAVLYYTSNASGNWTLNIRGDGSNSLNDIMDTGESITIAHLVTNGGTAYYNSAVQVDGVSVTPEWQNAAVPSAGNANSVDIYTYTVIKTADATFKVFAAQQQYA